MVKGSIYEPKRKKNLFMDKGGNVNLRIGCKKELPQEYKLKLKENIKKLQDCSRKAMDKRKEYIHSIMDIFREFKKNNPGECLSSYNIKKYGRDIMKGILDYYRPDDIKQ